MIQVQVGFLQSKSWLLVKFSGTSSDEADDSGLSDARRPQSANLHNLNSAMNSVPEHTLPICYPCSVLEATVMRIYPKVHTFWHGDIMCHKTKVMIATVRSNCGKRHSRHLASILGWPDVCHNRFGWGFSQGHVRNWREGDFFQNITPLLWCFVAREKLEIYPQRPRYFAAPIHHGKQSGVVHQRRGGTSWGWHIPRGVDFGPCLVDGRPEGWHP